MSDTTATAAPEKAAAPSKEVPSGMDQEAALLDAFASVPQLTKAICRPGPSGGVQLQVQFAQTNLPANNKRSLQHTIHIPDACKPEQRLVTGLPTELQNSALTSVSPSGELHLTMDEPCGHSAGMPACGCTEALCTMWLYRSVMHHAVTIRYQALSCAGACGPWSLSTQHGVTAAA